MDDLAKNQNRAHIAKAARYNEMTPMNADGGPIGATSPGEMPPPIRGDAPIFSDPHRNLRGAADNLAVKPGEKSRAHYAAEDRRRLRPGSGDTYK